MTASMRGNLPSHLQSIRQFAQSAIAPIRPADGPTQAPKDFLFVAQRTDAGRDLPPYYLVYFLLVELLGFRDLGQFEKVAWSVPIDFNGTAYLIEHRKMGLGIFAQDAKAQEETAEEIALRIKRGVKVAEPFFEWLAENAVRESKLNVQNNSRWLFERFEYLRLQYANASGEAESRKDERVVTRRDVSGGSVTSIQIPWYQLDQQSTWLALAAIDAFFSWTEHVFIHLAIIQGHATTGEAVAALAEADWQVKFKSALDLSEAASKLLFDKLVMIRRQYRNFVAHGAFGRRGEAFHFHSGAGAVPVVLTHKQKSGRFSLVGAGALDDSSTIKVLDEFVGHLWSGSRAAAKLYIQDAGHPLVLTMASDGTYRAAMQSSEEMNAFVEYLTRKIDDAANMDW